MGEAKRRRDRPIPGSIKREAVALADADAFLEAYWQAPGETEVSMRVGHAENGRIYACCAVGPREFALTSHECRVIAGAVAAAITQHGVTELADLVLGLRAVADHVDGAQACMKEAPA